jgi:hypothetical protein
MSDNAHYVKLLIGAPLALGDMSTKGVRRLRRLAVYNFAAAGGCVVLGATSNGWLALVGLGPASVGASWLMAAHRVQVRQQEQ